MHRPRRLPSNPLILDNKPLIQPNFDERMLQNPVANFPQSYMDQEQSPSKPYYHYLERNPFKMFMNNVGSDNRSKQGQDDLAANFLDDEEDVIQVPPIDNLLKQP